MSSDAAAPRVLVVDDEEVVRLVSRGALEHFGFSVDEASSGAECLARLAEERGGFDAILLDLTMPGMTGLETLARIRGLGRRVPVLLLSATEVPLDADLAALGVAAVLPKPCPALEVVEAVRAAIGR